MYEISCEGIGSVVVTCRLNSACEGGEMVKMVGDKCVGLCDAGDLFCGKVFAPRTDWVGVQVRGFMTVKCSGALSVGQVKLVADGNGGVKAADEGVCALVVSVNGDGTADICL